MWVKFYVIYFRNLAATSILLFSDIKYWNLAMTYQDKEEYQAKLTTTKVSSRPDLMSKLVSLLQKYFAK